MSENPTLEVYAWIVHAKKPIGFNQMLNFMIIQNIPPVELDDIIDYLMNHGFIKEPSFGFFEDNTKRWAAWK